MKIGSLLTTLVLGVSLCACTHSSSPPTAITTGAISNLVSSLDATATNADVDAYARMLSDDFTLTITSESQQGSFPLKQRKTQYVADMRESIRNYRVAETKTTIDQIDIAASGQTATIGCTLAQRSIALDSKRVCRLSMKQTFTVAMQGGSLLITELRSHMTGVTWE